MWQGALCEGASCWMLDDSIELAVIIMEAEDRPQMQRHPATHQPAHDTCHSCEEIPSFLDVVQCPVDSDLIC